ncbi:MAG: DUF58 domain-containing protein [Actinomycetota bacterium]
MIRTLDLATPDRVLRKVELWVGRRLEGVGPGAHRSLRLGEGVELADIREYVPGDDVRAIDWSVTARTGVPHVRIYEADREANIFFVIDRSASMSFGTAARTKEQLLREVVAAVSVLVLRRGNRLGALLFAEQRLAGLPPSWGRRAALRLLRTIEETAPAERVGGRLDLALDEAVRVVRRRSVVVVVSDWLDTAKWEAPLGRLSSRHEVIGVEIRDPREQTIPEVGPLILEDPETGRQLEVDTSRPDLRERFAEAAAAQRARRAEAIAAAGAAHLVVSTDREWLDDLLRFLTHRRRRRR